MPGRRVDPDTKVRAVALRMAGYAVADIAALTGVSERTLARIFQAAQTERGAITADFAPALRDRLIEELAASGGLRRALEASVAEDIDLAHRIRGKLGACISTLETSDHDKAREAARALAQVAAASRATQKMIRGALGAENGEDFRPPDVLQIVEMTAAEVEQLQARHRSPLVHVSEREKDEVRE